MILNVGRCAGLEIICDKCGFSELHFDTDDIFEVRRAARTMGWRIRIEPDGPPMEGGYVYLCPECREREESRPGKEE